MHRPSFLGRTYGGPALAMGLVVLLLMGACDPSVTVVKPSDQYRFSLFGTLNVAADTQVIRVEPIGDTTRIGAPPDIEASVVLNNVDTGAQVALDDSFEAVSGGLARVHNFRTADSILPGTKYRLAVRVNGEPVTTATTTTPAQAPILRHDPDSTDDKPFLLPCTFDFQDEIEPAKNTLSLRAFGFEHLAAVKVRYPVQFDGERAATLTQFDHYDAAAYRPEDDFFRVPVFYGRDLIMLNERGQGCPSRERFVKPYAIVTVAAGGPDWPGWRGASLNDLARPDTFSNVEGGHGFVGGIYSDTIQVPIRPRD